MILKSVLNSTKDVIFYKNYSSEDGKYIGCNCAFEEFVGKSKEEIIGKNDLEIFGEELGSFFRGKDLDVIKNKVDITNEEWVTYPDGEEVLLSTQKSLLRDNNDNIIGIMGVCRNITHRYANQQKILNQSKSLKESAKMISQNVIHSETDLKGIITKVSEAFCDISGYRKGELLGTPHNILRHDDMSSSIYKDMWQTIKSGNDWSGEIKNKRKDGTYYWVNTHITPEFDAEKNIIGYFSIRQDITAKMDLKKLNNSLENSKQHFQELSSIDSLTGIYNRRSFFEISEKLIKLSPRNKTPLTLMMIDIDFFKEVNDTYGHIIGDDILIYVTKTIEERLRKSDIFSRYGGEEFIVLLSDTDLKNGLEIAEEIRLMFSNNVYSDGKVSIPIKISIGVGEYKDEPLIREYIQRVDKNLYKAKENGRNRVESD